jgi:hypothetical protein
MDAQTVEARVALVRGASEVLGSAADALASMDETQARLLEIAVTDLLARFPKLVLADRIAGLLANAQADMKRRKIQAAISGDEQASEPPPMVPGSDEEN